MRFARQAHDAISADPIALQCLACHPSFSCSIPRQTHGHKEHARSAVANGLFLTLGTSTADVRRERSLSPSLP